MKKIGFILVSAILISMSGFGQTSDEDNAAFAFTKAPSTPRIGMKPGSITGAGFDYTNVAIETDYMDATFHAIGGSYFYNRWKDNWGIDVTIPASYTTLDMDEINGQKFNSAGFMFSPSLSFALKLAGNLDSHNLLGFGGLMASPFNFIGMWNSDSTITMVIFTPGASAHGGLKGNIMLTDFFSFVPFVMGNLNYTRVSSSASVNNTSDDSDPVSLTSFSTIVGFDILFNGYSLGAMADFKENTTIIDIHLKIPVEITYDK